MTTMNEFGPNSAAVAALLERAAHLTNDEVAALTSAWGPEGQAAEDAAEDAAWKAGRAVAWAAARDDAWKAGRAVAWAAARDDAWKAGRAVAWDDAWKAGRAVAAVATSAAGALVVRDLIPAGDFDLLYGPWAAVMEGGEAK